MHGWALQKIEREIPEFSQPMASFLLRAEARTVSAVLHAKSTPQLKEVLRAAMKRADIISQQLAQMATIAESMATKFDLHEFFAQIQLHNVMITQRLQHLTAKLNELQQGQSASASSQPQPSTPLTAFYARTTPGKEARDPSPSPSLTPTVVASQPASHEDYQDTREYDMTDGDGARQGREEVSAQTPQPSNFLKQLEAKSLMVQSKRDQRVALQSFGTARK